MPPPHEGSPGTGEIPSLVELAEHALTLAPHRIAPAVRALLGTVLHDGPLRDVLLHTWAWGPAAGWDLIADLEAHPPRLLRGLRYLCGDAPTPPIPHRLHRSRLLCSHLGNTLPDTRREGAREAGAWLAWAAGDLAETQRLLGHPGAPHANPRFVHTLKNAVNRGEKPRWGCISGNPQ
ncbi:hypothetical protein [Mycetocola spongiae]|uniref:hypothetical protein n=1 Tax=Mycetocola spongiae TaxID=2859226 RepID=UPI001CF20C7F|nr:hypothetical protein [Mycetocola spongiae]